ncbi:Nucleotide-sugar transporter [Paramicrosporidium saccamoebae]|uniref:Nucleotide-sugar transporter n=1 Tax=Paramicrosporidium saccamoebae TaxID=1246581 RepID=A0A2H9TP07_9FUNG|nr:Nucleotide-sugar transporter [Paramicrosporidium saccamoebae]
MPKNKTKVVKDTKKNDIDNSSNSASSDSDAPNTAEGSLGLIMSKLLKTNTTSTPVLSKRKAVERQLEEEKLDKRARALVRQELREKKDSAHRVPTMEDGNYEKGLKKYANKGVVQLFNAVQQHQLNKERAEKAAKEAKEAKKKPSSRADPKDVAALRVMFTPRQLIQQMGGTQIKLIFQTFEIVEEGIYLIAALLKSDHYDFVRHYSFSEPKERLLLLAPFGKRLELHSNIFCLPKLLANAALVRRLLRPDAVYADLLVRKWPHRQPRIDRLAGNEVLFKLALTKSIAQMGRLESLRWLDCVLLLSSDQHAVWLLDMLTPHMTPEMMVYFMERALTIATLGQSLEIVSDKIQEYMKSENSLGAIQVLLAGWHLQMNRELSNSHLLSQASVNLGLVYDPSTEKTLDDYKKVLEFCFSSLGAQIIPSARSSVWSTFANVISKCLDHVVSNMSEVMDAAQFVLQCGVPDHIPPFYSRRIYKSLRRISLSSSSILPPDTLPILPAIYMPIAALPLEMRLKKWLYEAPLLATSFRACQEFTDKYLRHFMWSVYHGMGQLPLNCTPHPVGTCNSISFSDAILTFARGLIQNGPVNAINLLVITASWPYAIMAREKLDLKLFFPPDEQEGCWASLSKRLQGVLKASPIPIMFFIKRLGFTRFFSPVEIRQLIDSSCNI